MFLIGTIGYARWGSYLPGRSVRNRIIKRRFESRSTQRSAGCSIARVTRVAEQLADGTLVTVLYFAHGSAGEEQAHWGETSCQALRYSEALVT